MKRNNSLNEAPASSEEGLGLRLRWVIVIVAAVVLVDQGTKAAVAGRWAPGTMGIPVIPGFFRLVHFANRGGAWGILDEYSLALIVFSIAALLFIAARFKALVAGSAVRTVCLALVAGGIAGNLIDRIFRGEVVDFLLFSIGSFSWPAFNVADSAICVGVLGFIATTFLEDTQSPGASSGAEASNLPSL